MKEKIINALQVFVYYIYPEDRQKAIEKSAKVIIKAINEPCCEKCKYYSDKFDKCEYHLMEITDAKILKCNDFTEMEGK